MGEYPALTELDIEVIEVQRGQGPKVGDPWVPTQELLDRLMM